MDSHLIFAALRDALANLYPEQMDARRVVDDAGVDPRQIAFSGRAITNWHNTLAEAIRQQRLDALLKVVRTEYEGNKQLATAYIGYSRLIDEGGQLEAPVQLSDQGGIISQALTSKIRNLNDAIDQLPDNDTKEMLRNQLQEYEKLAKDVAAGELERQRMEFDQKLAQQKVAFEQDQAGKQVELRLREAETKTQRIVRLLDKDLVSVLIGGALLIIITVSLIVMMGRGVVESRLLENAFLILLGYFFGQGAGVRTSTTVATPQKEKQE
jgi:hypothetical protein